MQCILIGLGWRPGAGCLPCSNCWACEGVCDTLAVLSMFPCLYVQIATNEAQSNWFPCSHVHICGGHK